MATGPDGAARTAMSRLPAWLVAACVAASGVVVLVSVPSAWRVRTEGCFADCPPGAIDSAAAARLDELGLGVAGYVAIGLVLALVLSGACLGVSSFLLHGAAGSGRRGAVTAAAALAAVAAGFPQLVPALVAEHPDLAWLGTLVDASVLLLVWWLAAFPDGEVRGWWARSLVVAAVAWVVIATLSAGTDVGALAVTIGTAVVGVLALATVIVGLSSRAGADRRLVAGTYATIGTALAVLAAASVLQMAGLAPIGTIADLVLQVVLVAAFLAIPIAVAGAVLRRGLWGEAASVTRIVAAGVVALAAVAGFAIGVALLHLVGAEPAIALAVPAALLAVAIPPLDRLAVRGARRVLTGSEGDRRRALRELDSRLALAAEMESAPDLVAGELAGALGMRGARIIVGPEAEVGPERDDEVRIPLVHGRNEEGALVLEPGRGGTVLDPAQLEALEPIRTHLAALLHARRLARELQASRRAILTARDDERRRVRDDLHDELGPTLAAAGLTLRAAEREAAREPSEAVRLVGEARSQLAVAVADVRRIVRGLRPPALDDLGLVGAVRAYASAVDGPVLVEVEGRLEEPLPALVQSAAYAIALEAIANAVRHSGGTSCRVSVSRVDALVVVEIADDGTWPDGGSLGLGLASMQRRAQELDGRLEVIGGPSGTTVRAVLPANAAPETR
ncbi:sensor histidine kinase [Agromyces sp. GXQ0307]|uniref:sensor histidine kinase n=1 Tax=Agromyces sp. GXQ0307 TaxID=3377835 RepID=UPI00383B32B0